jgi:hypothetical protein
LSHWIGNNMWLQYLAIVVSMVALALGVMQKSWPLIVLNIFLILMNASILYFKK